MRNYRSALTTALAAAMMLGCGVSATAQNAAPSENNGPQASDDASAIIVTARRVEERLQDVPISITVYNQQALSNKNVISANDLATYTPSLAANTNFGSDSTTFAIRGFAQDIGTAPSVGTYFGDVVTPRGASNGQPVGDGASVGDFFDLANVQVLKGPQGTLFGRNTTGGAVLFVPQKPTDRFEGYVEGGYGNFDMRRIQAVLNVPLSDSFRVRLGLDRQLRDGFENNVSGIGPAKFGNVNYWAGRLSIVGDLTPNLENYIIASYSLSKNSGAMNKLVAADPSTLFGAFASAQLAQQGSNFYNVENVFPDAYSRQRQWQVIDTVTWKSSDSLTIKNIASYAQLKLDQTSPIFGIRFQVPAAGQLYNTTFEGSVSPPGGSVANESTFTEEMRLQGTTLDSRFNWQAGGYLEIVRPLGEAGSQSPGFTSCADGNGSTYDCTDPFRSFIAGEQAQMASAAYGIPAAFLYPSILPLIPHIAQVGLTAGTTSFHDVGAYAQGTYKLTEQFKLTGGFRYTWDHEQIDSVNTAYQLMAPPAYGVDGSNCLNPLATFPACLTHFFTKSQKPTWLIDVDYTPTRDLLVYGKYSRGYRAATIAPNIPEAGTLANPDTTLNYVKPEKVDAYEVGLKSSFASAIHGTFDVAGFYNKFSDQQLQVGFLPFNTSEYPQTAAPINAGKSTIYGAEVEASISPFRGLALSVSYAYLHTRIDQVVALPSNPAYITQASFHVGDPEVLAPHNKVTAGATYTFPTPASWGRVSVGGSVTYRSSELVNYADRYDTDPAIATFSYLPALTLVNANANWLNFAGLPFDLNFFVNNLTNRKFYTFAAGLGGPQLGFEVANLGEPRMFGGTIKVKFGGR